MSQEFYEEILAHPVPLDRRVIRALTSSFALELYAWATYRVSRLQRRVLIPWPELARQFGSQERALRNFRVETRRALERIRVFYRELRFEVRREGLWLWPGRSHVQRQAVPKKAARGPEEPDERVARISGRQAPAGRIPGHGEILRPPP